MITEEVADVEVSLEPGDTWHSIIVCTMHYDYYYYGDIVETSCGLLLRWYPNGTPCEECMKVDPNSHPCLACGIPV